VTQLGLVLEAPPVGHEFFLGTHRPHWLYPGRRKLRPRGPLFVSIRQIRHARKGAYPRSDTPFAVDSGGYTELLMHGRWTGTAAAYARSIVALSEQTGTLAWAAIQDWMCEPWILRGGSPPTGGKAAPGTGLTVADHQRLTVESYLELRELAPGIQWMPVLQGQDVGDYLDHVEQYAGAGVDLLALDRVGLGSVCRRQSTAAILEIVEPLAGLGLRLHGFGIKSLGLRWVSHMFTSTDSLAWSFRARQAAQHGEPGAKGSDANCQLYAEAWRAKIHGVIRRGHEEDGACEQIGRRLNRA
jgi:hypothetical protein